MPRLAANLTLLYTEWPFLDRFEAAAEDGFTAVECQFPYDHPAGQVAERLRRFGLEQVLINAPAGDWARGERGLAALPGAQSRFREGVLRALDCAAALACPRIHVLAGLAQGDEAWRTYRDNLEWAAHTAQAHPVSLLIEPLNGRDTPGYLLQRQADAHALVQAIGAPNLQVQLDLYHCQIMEGDVTRHLRDGLASGRVGHLQIAGVPHRHEPAEGELNLPYLFEQVDALGWAGTIGCEYRPRAGTRAGLAGLRPWLASPRG
jgi:hydroxypyruvate isomerase